MPSDEQEFDPDLFDDRYKLSIVSSYSDIAGLTRDDLWRSTLQDREAAFARCLQAKHLRLMHAKHLDRQHEHDLPGLPPYSPDSGTAFHDYVAANLSTTTTTTEGEPHP